MPDSLPPDSLLGPALAYAVWIGVSEEELEGLETSREIYELARQHEKKKKEAQYNDARAKRIHCSKGT